MLKTSYELENYDFEIGIDEAGRGPLFGRVYAAAAILPKDNSFNHKDMKDSKKFTSKKKINDMSNYIKENAIVWSIQYEDEKVIDQINILQATYSAMHKCIKDVREKLEIINVNNNLKYTELLMVDGKFFKQYTFYKDGEIQFIPSICIEKGDNAYTNIAAASILAKVARDSYIEKLCEKHTDLITKYKIDTNKGYGSKHHIDGIKQHGICQFHRKTFGLCKTQELNIV